MKKYNMKIKSPRSWVYTPDFKDPDPTPLLVDPVVRIGRLGNGLTYYLCHNDNPEGFLGLRLVVKVGTVNETDEIRGISHFVEHMLFKGTEDYPGNSLNATLRVIGAEFGPDLNAYTSLDETVYKLSAKTDTHSNVTTMFHVLSQMASSAVFDPESVESEKGVVLDEMRLSSRYGHYELRRILVQGTPYEGCKTIGTQATVESFTSDGLRAYYEKFYVPSNMALIAVGDWQVDDLEDLTEKYFGSISANATISATTSTTSAPELVHATPLPGTPSSDMTQWASDLNPSTHVMTIKEKGFSDISIFIPLVRHKTGTVYGERLAWMQYLIRFMIRNRFTDAYDRGEVDWPDSPELMQVNHNRLFSYHIASWLGNDLAFGSMVTDYWTIWLTALEHGFTETEMRHAMSSAKSRLQHILDSSETRQTEDRLDACVNHFLYGDQISATDDMVARVHSILEDISVTDVTEYLRWLMERSRLVVLVSGIDVDSLPTTAELDAAITAAVAAPQPVVDAEAEVDQLIPDPPAPVRFSSKEPLNLFGEKHPGCEWTFPNGVRVMFVVSDLAKSEIQMRIVSLGGWSVLNPGDMALTDLATDAVTDSGLGELTISQLKRFMQQKQVSVEPSIWETTQKFTGFAASSDAEILFQLVHLLSTTPQIDDQAFRQTANTAEMFTSAADTNPDMQAELAYLKARYGTSWHWPLLTSDQLETLNAGNLLSIYRNRFGSVGDVAVAVVGDIDASRIEELASRYLATLPAGSAETPVNRRRAMPEDVIREEITVKDENSTIIDIYHEARRDVTPFTSVVADVLESALSERLFQAIRESVGASYSVGASLDWWLILEQRYESKVSVTLNTARFNEIYATTIATITDIANDELKEEELKQAKTVVHARYNRPINARLANLLVSRLYTKDDDLLTSQRSIRELENVTPRDVRLLATDLYKEGGRIEIVRRPSGA